MKRYSNYIDGEWVPCRSGRWYELKNPGRCEDSLGEFPLSQAADVEMAVNAADAAFGAWSRMLPDKRAGYIYTFIEKLSQNVERLGGILCREQGKTLQESVGEVSRSVKECKYIVGEAARLNGMSLPSEREHVTNTVVRVPIGVVAAITPWNFPVLTPIRKIIPALIAGCTVVFKPSYDTPLCAVTLMELLDQTGIPRGVVNLIIGRGQEIGDAIAGHEKVKGISFTGSTIVGKRINTFAAEHFTKVQLEMGGKNPAVVAEYQNIDYAAEQICAAAFANAGQRCTAISRVIVPTDEAEELEQTLKKKIAAYRVGYGFDPDTQIGPVINEKEGGNIIHFIEIASQEGAAVTAGGRRLRGGLYDGGFYIEPTLITNVTPDMTVAKEEIFGPVLVVIRVKDFAAAMTVANQTRYGLAASIFSDSRKIIYQFVNGIESGMVHINHGTASESFMPFGGVKHSGHGNFGIGVTNKDFYTTWKVIYDLYEV